MDRLSPQTKKILLIGIPVMIFVLLVAINGPSSNTNTEPTGTTYITLPPEPTFDKNANDFVSPYQSDDLHIASMSPVWNEQLITDNLTITTTTHPDVQFVSRIDVEDVVTIHMPRQRLNTDMSKAKIIAILHEDMQDPYVTNPQEYQAFCKSEFAANDDGSWTAQFMLGYDASSHDIVDILFVYENNIEYYTMMYITQKHKYSKMYYQWLTPDETVSEMNFICGDTVITYGYYPNKVHTLAEWIKSDTNPHQWHEVQGMIVDPSVTWYLPAEQSSHAIHDNIIFDMLPIQNNLLPGVTITLASNNPQYLTSLMHQPRNVVEDRLGTPKRTSQFSNVIKMEYNQYIIYLHPQNGVTQIDVLPGAYNIINALPTHACSGEELTKVLRLLIVPYNDYRNTTDVQAQYYGYHLSVPATSCTISYVWAGEKHINPQYDKFTRIVIHSGEEYTY